MEELGEICLIDGSGILVVLHGLRQGAGDHEGQRQHGSKAPHDRSKVKRCPMGSPKTSP